MNISPIEKISITDRVTKNLRDYIINSDCMPGDKLPTEAQLVSQLQVGRSTIREALRILQTMGYVNIVHGRGAFVESKSPTSKMAMEWFAQNVYALSDIYAVRIPLELLIARLSAEKIRAEQATALMNNVHRMNELLSLPVEQINSHAIAKLDEEFHELLCKGTNNQMLLDLYSKLTSFLRTYRLNSFSLLHNLHNVQTPHMLICDAVIQHDQERAEAEMRRHMKISLADAEEAANGKLEISML